MLIQWSEKYILTCSLIILCPKRSLTTDDVEVYSAAEYKGKSQKLHMKLSEPGFNYTDEEMKKLKIWPGGIIPYFIDDYSFDLTLRRRLRSLLASYHSVTGLEFFELSRVPDDVNERWVLFINRRGVLGCEDYSPNSFTVQGVQRVVLGYDCFSPGGGELASTVLALAAVPPQHNAPDRDRHITVVMDNIIPEKRDLFRVLKNDEWLFHLVTYDFLSAGHYGFHKYTINGSATIIPKDMSVVNLAIGEGHGISRKDIWKIRMLYNFISNKRKEPKASDCSKIFKPGSKFSEYQPPRPDIIIPRIKPAKYLGLHDEEYYYDASDENDEEQINSNHKLKKKSKTKIKVKNSTMNTENDITDKTTNTEDHTDKTMSLEARDNKKLKLMNKKSKLFKFKGKDKLDYLKDFDTDKDGGRVKLLGKLRGVNKKRNALHSRFQLSKLSALSDFDTDKNSK